MQAESQAQIPLCDSQGLPGAVHWKAVACTQLALDQTTAMDLGAGPLGQPQRASLAMQIQVM